MWFSLGSTTWEIILSTPASNIPDLVETKTSFCYLVPLRLFSPQQVSCASPVRIHLVKATAALESSFQGRSTTTCTGFKLLSFYFRGQSTSSSCLLFLTHNLTHHHLNLAQKNQAKLSGLSQRTSDNMVGKNLMTGPAENLTLSKPANLRLDSTSFHNIL